MSDDREDQNPGQPDPEEEQAEGQQTNFERLLAHLGKDSLAAKLIEAYAGAYGAGRAAAIRAAADDRLTQIRRSHDEAEN